MPSVRRGRTTKYSYSAAAALAAARRRSIRRPVENIPQPHVLVDLVRMNLLLAHVAHVPVVEQDVGAFLVTIIDADDAEHARLALAVHVPLHAPVGRRAHLR